ncbi:MAG TPA: hypothetical protein VD903_12410 [Pseudonocardia sp.]|nr:hypothetical protein [Pseudonocardia sp.]
MAPLPRAVPDGRSTYDDYADHADHTADYPDYGDHRDHRDHGDDRRRARRDTYRSARPRSRGQVFAGVVLVLALMVSAVLGLLTYQTLASVDLISADPFASVSGWATALGGAAVGALGVFLLAAIALAIARPKALAAFVLAASLLLPVGAVVVGTLYGGDVLRQNVQDDLATESADAARALADELERSVPDIGPLRDLIVRIAGQGG